jgi:2',3'-cyclic-nucleotide 2'-phosphodiesterase/3'-nucleotidase
VAINSYRGNGGGGHLVSGACIPKEKLAARTLSSTDKDLRFYLMKWIEKSGTVTPVKLNNWQIIPAEWWKKGMEKDYRLLFGKNN